MLSAQAPFEGVRVSPRSVVHGSARGGPASPSIATSQSTPTSAPRSAAVAGTASAPTERQGGTRERFFGALRRYPTFRRLWLGVLFASTGQWMQQISLGWLALIMTDSPSFVGWVTFASGMPFLVVAPLGGALIDRTDRRRLLLICQAIAAMLAVVTAVDVIGGWVQPWHLLGIAFANGSLLALLSPTQQSLLPALVARHDLTNAIGLMSAGQNMTRVAGPSLAGVVIGLTGVGPAFLLQAIALICAFVMILGITLPPRPARTGGPGGIFDGIRLIMQRADLRAIFLLACIPTFFVFPYISFLSVFARDILQIGAWGLGVLMAASAVGAVIGSLLVAGQRRTEGTGATILTLVVVYGGVVIAIAASRTVVLSLCLLLVAGLIGSSFMSMSNVLLQHRISDNIRGRVMGAYLLTFGLMPLGALPMGMVADRMGAPFAVTAGAIASSLLAAWLGVTSPILRKL